MFLIAQRPNFIKSRQMIRCIGMLHSASYRTEYRHRIFCFEYTVYRYTSVRMITHGIQKLLGLLAVIINSLSISPSGRGKKECCREIFFPIRCRRILHLTSARRTLPCKIVLKLTAVMPHISRGPFPQPVKFVLLIHLHADHHAIGHTLRTNIIGIRGVNVRHIRLHWIINPFLLRSIKEFLPCFLYFCIYLLFSVAEFLK